MKAKTSSLPQETRQEQPLRVQKIVKILDEAYLDTTLTLDYANSLE